MFSKEPGVQENLLQNLRHMQESALRDKKKTTHLLLKQMNLKIKLADSQNLVTRWRRGHQNIQEEMHLIEYKVETRGPSASTLIWISSYEGYMASEKKIFECFFFLSRKFNLSVAMATSQISDLDKIHIVDRGLLRKNFSTTFVKISAVTQK